MRQPRYLLYALLLVLATCARASVHLPAIFSDHMVLQQGRQAQVWGTADPGEAVTISLAGQQATTTAGADGRWRLALAAVPAGGPYEMTVTGTNTLTVRDVLVGEVWLCGGQSNMSVHTDLSLNAKEEIAQAQYPQIRMFTVNEVIAYTPQADCTGSWQVCSPRTAAFFSAVGYYFARELHQQQNVPIGMIHASRGATLAEAWTPREALLTLPAYQSIFATVDKNMALYSASMYEIHGALLSNWLREAERARAAKQPLPLFPLTAGMLQADPRTSPHMPSGLYQGMIAPLVPYTIAGAIWYQGEQNAGNAVGYRTVFPLLILAWREAWGQGDFPFLYVQLANFRPVAPNPGPSAWAELREVQRETLRVPNTAMAVAIDIGDANNIHPADKQNVGKRLALAAQAIAYGQPLEYSGPLFQSAQVQGDAMRITFTHLGGGLATRDGGALSGFAIAGEDKQFVWATATIDGDTVVVRSDAVAQPVAVRYAWADNPVCNLINKAGLPASPFRTDTWEH